MATYQGPVHRGAAPGVRATCDPSWPAPRRRIGGLDLPAAAAGTLAAFGLLVLLAGLLAGAGIASYQQGIATSNALPLVGLIAGALGILLSLLLGGWVTGRMARYDGKRNGLFTGVLFLVLTATLGSVAVKSTKGYKISDSIYLPTWVTDGPTSIKAVAIVLITVAIILGAGLVGGACGARWHRNVDDVIRLAAAGGAASYRLSPTAIRTPTELDGALATGDTIPG